MIAFILTMPRNNSWNGKWSGEEQVFARVFSERTKKRYNLQEASYYYDFDDGWAACVTVKNVDQNEGRRLARKSAGFCGYDWMINDIMMCGRINKR